jgi:hypothetical protein
MDLMLMILTLAVIIGPGWGVYTHQQLMSEKDLFWQKLIEKQAEIHGQQLRLALDRLHSITVATRYQTCISALPEKQRWAELQKGGYCEQVARQGLIPP